MNIGQQPRMEVSHRTNEDNNTRVKVLGFGLHTRRTVLKKTSVISWDMQSTA